MNKITLITGATSGIGQATAEKFAQNKHDLIITGRRTDRLENIAGELGSKYGISIFPAAFDIRHRGEVDEFIKNLPDEWKNIKILINNAGLAAGLDPIQEGNIDDWEQMIDTNIKGLLYITRAVAPMMIEQGGGHIINIGSIAGREVYASGNVYCATKHAVDALTKGMRIDLLPYGIKVTQIAPGLVETEFSIVRLKGDTDRAKKVYAGYDPLTGKDIAEAIYFATTLPEHVNINDLLIMPTAQANATTVFKKKH
ncbi:MAG: SDR family oxidoreductase [Chlorobi bacterium]|nr:SDR family oxidoreductase [Chlorobiota bacterium]